MVLVLLHHAVHVGFKHGLIIENFVDDWGELGSKLMVLVVGPHGEVSKH